MIIVLDLVHVFYTYNHIRLRFENAVYMWCIRKVMRLVLFFFIWHLPINEHYPPQNSSLGKPHTAGKLLPLPVAVLEFFMWKCIQLVCHDLLDVVHSSKMTFEVEFEFWEKEEDTWNQASMVAAEHFRPFLTCKFLRNEVRLAHCHGHPKMLYAT